ncbi:transposase [Leptolyngbyaceae cyanobacterium UHCC 1019]
MKHYREKQRRSIRLQGYDYASAGAYFITICTQNRACVFGEISDGTMQLNDAGQMVEKVWQSSPQRFPHVCLDAFVVMPNHVHGIIQLRAGTPEERAGTRPAPTLDMKSVGAPLVGALPTVDNANSGERAGTRPAPTLDMKSVGAPLVGALPTVDDTIPDDPKAKWGLSLGDVIGVFKSIATHQYTIGVKQQNWEPFHKRLWQRNYYEHVIRDETALQKIWDYIQSNPLSWQSDQLHPNNPSRW